MVDVDVEVVRGGVVVRCGFQDTLSEKCFVQLVSGAHGGYYEEKCLEGGRDASYTFTGLVSATYTVLVYGLDSQESSCLPSSHHNYIHHCHHCDEWNSDTSDDSASNHHTAHK